MSEKLFKKYNDKLTPLSSLIIAIVFLAYGFHNAIISIPAFAIAAFCDSVLYPIQSEVFNDFIPSEQRATLISVDSMFFSLSMIIMFPIAGVIADCLKLTIIFPIIGILLLLFISIWHLIHYLRK